MKILIVLFLFLSSPVAFARNDIISGHGTGLIYDANTPKFGRTYARFAECDNLPDEFDLRDLGNVPPIRNQGNCGSCWSFSKTASLESAYAYANGEMLDLSEQEMVSCDKSQWGCNGGILRGFDYQIKNGQGLESDFPYTARDSACKKIQPKVKGQAFYYAGAADRPPTEKEVMCALYLSKTIPWTVVAADNSWSNPPTSDEGTMRNCGSRGVNHAIGLVGWKKIQGKVYFKLRNSWGTNWGSTAGRPGTERGYNLATHRCNLLNDEVAYITTEKTCKPPVINLPPTIKVPANTDTSISVPEVEGNTEYTWYEGKRRVGKGPTIFINQDRTSALKNVAKNACATAETLIKTEVK